MANFTIEENYGTYKGNTSYILDGNTSNLWQANDSNSQGKYVLITSDKLINVTTVVYTTTNSSEIFKSGTYLQYSTDKSNWTDVGQFDGKQSVTFNVNAKCQYLRIYCKSGSGYVSISELAITYTEKEIVKYNVTIEDNGYNVTPKGTQEYEENTVVPITIEEDPLPKVYLDGADITDQFTKKAVTSDATFTGAPSGSSYTGLSSGSNGVASAVGKTAENPFGDTLNWYGSNGATVDSQYAQYTFDLSSIPSNATNIKVSCKVAGTAENATYSHQAGGKYSVWGLCANGTAKGSQIYTTSTSVAVIEFTDTGTWTRAELNNLQLRHYVGYYGGSTNGATLTIKYTVPGGDQVYYEYELTVTSDHVITLGGSTGTNLRIKANGSYKKVVKIFKKENGTYTEIDASALDASANYVKAN